MRAAGLPMPGLLLGAYPERREPPSVGKAGLPVRLRLLFDRMNLLEIGRYPRFVAKVRAKEAVLRGLPEEGLSAAIRALRLSIQQEGFCDEHVAQAFALIGTTCARMLGMQLYDAQLIASHIVLTNRLAEMATGEGKTLGVALAAATAALAGIPVHVITANDYLVARDAELMRPIYAALGLSVGTVTQGQEVPQRRTAYACDITYCTAKELVFDYLRDGLGRGRDPLRWRVDQLAGLAGEPPMLRGLCMAIVDEADSILIDEARMPLILSQAAGGGQEQRYLHQSLELARMLRAGEEFIPRQEALTAELTAVGRERLEQAAQGLEAVWHNRLHREETVCTALAALHLYQRDRHYLVRAGKVLVIDETTGRIAPGRIWSRGLHQLIDLKEGCEPSTALVTAAQITYQRFFPRYLRLGGVSGTLRESRRELLAVYGLAVRCVPLRRPSQRKLLPARLFTDRQALWPAVVQRLAVLQQTGQPVLVGTESVADSEALSRQLTASGLVHSVLNARNDEVEAAIVAAAGGRGAITVTTNMAGRGTDIPLAEGVAALGGLHILCCQLNSARRIDRQLAGRCARQGDPGSVETWLSLQTPLLKQNLPRWLLGALRWRTAAVPDWMIRRGTEWLQRLEEQRSFLQRKHLLEHDKKIERQLSFGAPRE